jgi:LuxR family transcriptional regulator, maltose regulon positive regulatory protein
VEHKALSMMLNGELTTLLDWLEKVDFQATQRPWLLVYQAWALVHTGQQETAAATLDRLGQNNYTTISPSEQVKIQGHIAAIRAHIAAYRWDAARTIDFAHQALEKLPETDLSVRSYVIQVLGGAYLLIGDLKSASHWLVEARRVGKSAGNLHVAVLATFMLANIRADQGCLRQAAETFRDALKLATTPSGRLLPVAARAFNGLGRIYYEWNDLEAVTKYMNQCNELAQQWGNANALVSAHITMARVRQAQGNLEDAQACLDDADQLARDHSLAPGGVGSLQIFQVGLWLATGNLEPAARWAEKTGFMMDDEVPPLREAEYRTFVRVLLAQKQADGALDLIKRLLSAAESAGKVEAKIELFILQSLAFQAKKEIPQALKALEDALALAQPEGYLRKFIDEGEQVANLLRHAGSQGIFPRYVARLLMEFNHVPDQMVTARQPLIEPLSEREMDVLRLIAAGLSNQEIAQKLIIAGGTVKAHTASIYQKLDVSSRTEAVARARELNIL